MSAPILLVFLKEPVPGRVKTRLGADLGAEAACAVYRRLVSATLAGLSKAREGAGGGDVEPVIRIVFDPAEAEDRIREWLEPDLVSFAPEKVEWEAQVPGGLGERLGAAFHSAFRAKPSMVAAIGTDCPTIQASHFEESLAQIEADEADVVFGPAGDGGYYLVALARETPAFFEGIPWSTEETLPASMAQAARMGLKIGLLETMEDVDDLETLRRSGFGAEFIGGSADSA